MVNRPFKFPQPIETCENDGRTLTESLGGDKQKNTLESTAQFAGSTLDAELGPFLIISKTSELAASPRSLPLKEKTGWWAELDYPKMKVSFKVTSC